MISIRQVLCIGVYAEAADILRAESGPKLTRSGSQTSSSRHRDR